MSRHAGPMPRRGLGRGLGSLIPTAPPESETPEAAAERVHDGPTTATVTAERPGPGVAAPVPHQAGAANGAADRAADRAAGRDQGRDQGRDPSGAGTESSADDADDADDAAGAAPDRSAVAADGPAPVAGAHFAELPVDQITPNPRQPREVFEEEAMAELVHSVKEVGLLQPVVVRRTGDAAYELIMGERRWRATREAGLSTIPAIVRDTGDDAMLRDALLENLHRAQLNPLEEAAAYRQLLDDFGCTHDELAGRIGRSRPQISNTLRLLNLSPAVQRRVAAGVLSAGHARALLAVAEPGQQDRLAGRVVSEGISVRGLEELVAVGETGAGDDDRPRVRPPRPTAPGLAELGDRLSDRLDTRVKVTLGRNRGKITIDFASLSDLERIVGVIDPRNRSDRPI